MGANAEFSQKFPGNHARTLTKDAETEINLENTADLVGKSRKNVANRGKMEKSLIKTVYFF
jgi:hypothetical protein